MCVVLYCIVVDWTRLQNFHRPIYALITLGQRLFRISAGTGAPSSSSSPWYCRMAKSLTQIAEIQCPSTLPSKVTVQRTVQNVCSSAAAAACGGLQEGVVVGAPFGRDDGLTSREASRANSFSFSISDISIVSGSRSPATAGMSGRDLGDTCISEMRGSRPAADAERGAPSVGLLRTLRPRIVGRAAQRAPPAQTLCGRSLLPL